MNETHSQAAMDIMKDVLNQKPKEINHKSDNVVEVKKTDVQEIKISKTSFNCQHCNFNFNTNKDLTQHNKDNHIPDTWPDSGTKRTVSMVKTSSESEPKRKRPADEEDMKERSDMMDKKILEKRKQEEVQEMLRHKELVERQRQEEMLNQQEKKKKEKKREKEKKT